MKNKAALIVLAWLSALLVPIGLKAATDIDINNPSLTNWKNVFPQNANYDIVGDISSVGTSPLDIVGDATYPAVCIQFNDDGSQLAVRIRVNNCEGSPANPQFSSFAYIGIDADLNGTIDFFLGAFNPTGGGAGRLGIYLSDPDAPNTMQGVTGIGSVLAAYQPVAGVNYSVVQAGDGSNFSGNPDYFITFKFNTADVQNAISGKTKENITFAPSTPFMFYAGTSTADNTLNGDVCGIDNRDSGPFPLWSEIGSEPVSTDNVNRTIYTVYFDKNQGDIDEFPQEIRVAEGEPLVVYPTPPVRWGFRMIGWSTDINDDETLAHGVPLGTIINGEITLYAVWKSYLSDLQFIEELVHFDATGGNTTGGSTFKNTDAPAATTPAYRHVMSNDDIIQNQPVPTNPPTISLPGGTNTYAFAGWVTDVQTYSGSSKNIISFSGNAASLANTTIKFFTWTEPVTDLSEVYQSHSGENELTVYALWYAYSSNSQGGKLTFFDNIYGPGAMTNTVGGSQVYYEYLTNSGSAAFNPAPVVRQGFVFRGWSTDYRATAGTYLDPLNPSSTQLTASTNNFPKGSGQNTNLYAIWTPLNYVVNFVPNTVDHMLNPLIGAPSGVPGYVPCVVTTAGQTYPKFPTPPPSLSGYTFMEWNTRPDGSGFSVQANGVGDVISAGGLIRYSLFMTPDASNPLVVQGNNISGYLTLYAIWDRGDNPTPIHSRIAFDAMGGHFPVGNISTGPDGYEQVNVPAVDGYLQDLPAPVWPVSNQYGEPLFVFAGWSFENTTDRSVASPPVVGWKTDSRLLQDVTLYAVWIPNASITFHPNGGYWPDGTVYSIRVSIDGEGYALYVPGFEGVPDNHPNRNNGYIFSEWNTALEGGGSIYHWSTPVTGTMNVYAQWSGGPRTGDQVAIYFDFNYGSGEIVSYSADRTGKIIELYPDPVRSGWIFMGWYTEPACDNAWDFDTLISTYCPSCAYIYLYARWRMDPSLMKYPNLIINHHLIQRLEKQ